LTECLTVAHVAVDLFVVVVVMVQWCDCLLLSLLQVASVMPVSFFVRCLFHVIEF